MILRKVFSFATLTLLVALTLSTIAAWYSVLGLTAIFAAAVVPIMIMGGALEFAKVITTLWLHKYWNRASWRLKLYLIPAVVMLAFLTSMGIFGFLSKAHSDQSLVSGDVQAKVTIYDEKIKTSKENIDADHKALQQMDAAVDQVMGRSTDVTGAQQSVNIRKSQAKERARLSKEIEEYQASIAKLNEDAAPIRAQIRKVDAEVGPIKYIAALIYGDNPDSNLLERAVRWVIIVIVFVFDPLALTLVLAAQSSYEWLEEDISAEQEESELKKNMKRMIADAETIERRLDELKEEQDKENDFLKQYIESKGTGDSDLNLEIIEENKNDESVQPIDVESDVTVGEDILQEPTADAVETPESVEQDQTDLASADEEREIITDGVTVEEAEGKTHAVYEGKSISKDALRSMYPELFTRPALAHTLAKGFGTEFPNFATKGDIFVRVDVLPNRVFKFDGSKWIDIDKDLSTTYLYDEEYIKYLVSKLETGEYDIDLLTESEKEQIEDYLSRN